MKYFSLFSGAGGFEIGMGDKGECVGFSEINKYAIKIYEKHFNHKNYGDCTKINWSEVPDFDLLVGGSPCQDFSIAGKREGIGGERSGLVWEYIRALKEKKPRYFIWENVKGVMSSRKGFDFASILTAFSESGYSLWWQVLNAKDFGVPQNRERVFVVGYFGGECPREIFFDTRDNQKNGSVQREKNKQGARISCLNSRYGQRWSGEGYIANQQSSQSERNQSNNRNIIRRETYTDDWKIRRLTPVECERLMSWEDNWTEGVSDTQRYKLCDNGVVSKVVQAIVENLIL